MRNGSRADIVVFDHVKHIGVISDKRDADGFSYVLHNMNQQRRENDYLAFSRPHGRHRPLPLGRVSRAEIRVARVEGLRRRAAQVRLFTVG